MASARRLGSLLVLLVLPVTVAVVGVSVLSPQGLWPWSPPLPDFEVYWRTGQLVFVGGDLYHADGMPWLYPPFAALLAAGLAVLPWGVVAALWVVLDVMALMAILYRLGLSGIRLSIAATVAIVAIAPVRQALFLGQVGILLLAAVVLDVMPGPRLLRRRILPEGWLVGVAAAIKLTPALIAVYTFLIGKRSVSWRALVAFVIATGLGFAVLWGPSVYYWTRLASGDSGANDGIIYVDNQSVWAMWARLSHESGLGGVWAAVAVLVLGLVAAVRMYRWGQPRLALVLAGVTSLLASPISWSHHFVWIVVLLVVVWQERALPTSYRVLALGYGLWVSVAPFWYLPHTDGAEYHFNAWELVVDDLGLVWGVALLLASIVVAGRRGGHEAQREGAGELSLDV